MGCVAFSFSLSRCPTYHNSKELMRRRAVLTQSWRRCFGSGVFDKVSDGLASSLSSLMENTKVFQDERMVTELRRPFAPASSSELSLAERLKQQRNVQQHLIPTAVKVDKSRQYLVMDWPKEAVEAVQGKPGAAVCQTRAMAEYLRVYTPSTDGKFGSPNVIIYGRKGITITDIIPVGSYALRLVFSDDHDGGIYSYEYLYYLTEPSNKMRLMREYIRELRARRKSREPPKRSPSKRRLSSSVDRTGDEKEYRAPAFSDL
ncbi:hypothetical protein AGDE_01863 [Angomonas deanei]|uniref:Gamma-butyrobetaine hydroxylase-like N-terminal domain-containing protein n=1 Tax=Angomonas deanei TaxID=59799 RepID=A0A7G2CP39_9TRYP|nr:hypothetical protein AGDE_01863 [Angomonas deanei]CAD2221119.1 Protein of unknown function (DUF971), putative [Angomonas deanei]|eukprot:EPY42060.1 hypothetical protein AGDE_01863 [Angomonas deanei]